MDDVAVAVEVAKKRELLMERKVQALLPAVVSTSASCGPVLEATVRFQNGVVVPMPRKPALERRMPSVNPALLPLVKKARAEAGEVVEVLVRMEAIRAVEVAEVVASPPQPASWHEIVSLKRMPVPMPGLDVDVARWKSEKRSLIPALLLSAAVT